MAFITVPQGHYTARCLGGGANLRIIRDIDKVKNYELINLYSGIIKP